MRYKVLGSASHNFAHSFVNADMGDVIGDLAHTTVTSGATEFRVDLLSREAGPFELLSPLVRECIGQYVDRFLQHVAGHGVSAEAISKATLWIRFDSASVGVARRPDTTLRVVIPYDCTVDIVDDRGKLHSGTVRGDTVTAPLSLRGLRDGRWPFA